MAKRKRFRLKFEFWLDINRRIESDLADAIAVLKEQRLFASYVRDGLRLMLSLAKKDTSVLLTLFPAVVRGIEEAYHSDELARLNARLDELTGIIEVNGLKAPAEKPMGRRASAERAIAESPGAATITVSKAAPVTSPAATFLEKMKAFRGAE